MAFHFGSLLERPKWDIKMSDRLYGSTKTSFSRTTKWSASGEKRHWGEHLWQGRFAGITSFLMALPWNIWWQTALVIAVTYEYVTHLLLGYMMYAPLLELILLLAETVFIADWILHMIHTYWPIVRYHIRVQRRSTVALVYDGISIPPHLIFRFGYKDWTLLLWARWLVIFRIYRLCLFYTYINGSTTRRLRQWFIRAENFFLTLLVLHMGACLWFYLQLPMAPVKPWYNNTGYPVHVSAEKLKFHNYIQCFYYVASRCFNTIFGDAFPMTSIEKLLTCAITLFGFCYTRYCCMGQLAWEVVLNNQRWSEFVSGYHHMLKFLKTSGMPNKLVEQAKNYKKHLWTMKDGVLVSEKFHELPQSLQTELIYDINVALFHQSVLFRNAPESFMRHISMIVKHELYLEGQQIWDQGVVKSGMLCVKRGVIEMLSDEDDESPMISFKDGTVLGELSLFYSIPSKVTVKAATYVELQIIRRTDFMRAMFTNPTMLKQIRTKIDERLKSAIKRQKAIQEYDSGDSRLLRTRYRPMKLLKDRLAKVEEEDPTFIDDSYLYYKDENNVRQPKFTDDYLELYVLSPNVTTIDAPRICLNSRFPWILEPNTAFTLMFDVLHFLLILYVCVSAPMHSILRTHSSVEEVMDCIVVFGLLLNIYLQLTTSIIIKGNRKVTVREIAEQKMSSFGFYLDIISVFPLYIFADTLDPGRETTAYEVSKLFPVLQVWHLVDYMTNWEANFVTNVKLICLAKYCILLIIMCYWSGCLLYLYACPKGLCGENSWLAQLIYFETKWFMTRNAKHERPILSALSFGTSVITGSGSETFHPGTADQFVVILIFIAGTFLQNSYFGSMCGIDILSGTRLQQFRESMRELFYFLTVNQVSGKIKDRVKKFFTVQWYYNNAISLHEVFKDISPNIQQEVFSTEMIGTLEMCPLLQTPVLREHTLLYDVGNPKATAKKERRKNESQYTLNFQQCSRDFLQTVAGSTKTVVLPDNEVVQNAGDISRDMYIIQKGHCNFLDCNGKTVHIVGPGSRFGVLEMLFGLPKVYTVVTATNCILRHIEFSSLVQCWSTFPEVAMPINTTLQRQELIDLAAQFEEAKPLIGRVDNKTNRFAQEIKESFVMLRGVEQRKEYLKAFDRLGYFRYVRYIFVPGCITPHGLFLKVWCTLRFLVAIYYTISIPYNVAIGLTANGFSLYNYADIFLYVDIIVMAYVAYYNEKSLLITHPLLTVTQYLKTTFILDLISVFPFEVAFRFVNDHIDVDRCRLNRILLVTRVIGAFAYWESDLMRVNIVVTMLKYIPVILTIVNVIASIMFTSNCKTYVLPDTSWILVNCTTNKHGKVTYGVNEYVFTALWALEVFIGCGCNPASVPNSMNLILVMVLQVLGFLYFAYMFGYIASTRAATSHALLDHNENKKDLENFLYQEKVDPALTEKTMKYFEYVWKRTNGSNPQKICRGLNTALMEDTLVFMYERALREVPLFGKVERSFIRVITQHLSEKYFLKGETVVKCRDLQHHIYIIYRGKVDVLNSCNEMLCCMGPGGMFGNFTGKPVSCSDVSIYASRSLDLLGIRSQTFFGLVKYYPKIYEPLKKAFEISKDYILPISMDVPESSSEDEDNEAEEDTHSRFSEYDSEGGDITTGNLSAMESHSNISSRKSGLSVGTLQSIMSGYNIIRPGSLLFQSFGYLTSVMVTGNYALVLYELVTLNDCTAIFWTQAIFDAFFYLIIYHRMHQGYFNKNGVFISDSVKCRARYFRRKGWLWCDILINFPLELLGFCMSYPPKAMHYLRAHKLFRLIYLMEFYQKTSLELTNNLTALQASTTLFVVILLLHTAGCIWLIIMTALAPVCIIRALKIHLMDDETPQHHWGYVSSMYVVVSMLTSTGGDEYFIEHLVPFCIAAVVLTCGKMLGAMIVATAIQIYYSVQHGITKYEKQIKELIDILKNQGLSEYQTKKFWKYVTQLWVNERGRQLPVLLAQTPYVRRCDLMSAMFGQHLRNCYLFSDTGEAFLRQVTASLDYNIFFPGNYIINAGDNEARMYWVLSGSVSVITVRCDLTETMHELLKPGDVFGILQGITRGVAHVFSYRAETNVNIISLSYDSWRNILQFFPEAKQVIAERADLLFTQRVLQ